MNEQSANSYDLLQAQQLLNILVPKAGSATKEKPVHLDAPNYSRLSTGELPQSARQTRTTDVAANVTVAEEPEMAMQNFDSWESCIAWCMSSTRAEAAFVVDSQGFVIASRGRVPSQGFEGAGAELICSIEQLERVAPDAGRILCIDVDFDKRRIIGFVATCEGTPPYVVGLVAPEPLRMEVKHKMVRQILGNLPNLD
jgi:hypothetical protein